MSDKRQDYCYGTYLTYRLPWGLYTGGAALCPDGTVRRLKRIATTSDTCFSIPASVTARGRTVAGFVQPVDDNGENILRFYPLENRRNANAFEPDLTEEEAKSRVG